MKNDESTTHQQKFTKQQLKNIIVKMDQIFPRDLVEN